LDDSAYRQGLALLARRELSTAQLRARLARRGHDPAAIDAAVARLSVDRSLDDARAAGAMARTAIAVHGHGPGRVARTLRAAGIPPALAERALAEAFGAHDPDVLLAAALARRLRGRDRLADAREYRRLHRWLLARGFDPARVRALLRRHAPRDDPDAG
jgi:regulatory protein